MVHPLNDWIFLLYTAGKKREKWTNKNENVFYVWHIETQYWNQYITEFVM